MHWSEIENILHHILTAAAQTGAQLLVVFGIVFAVAIVLWFVSQGIRRVFSSRVGMAYYYFVAPGVACHETGHALGCLLTRTKIVEFVPFHPSPDGTLGYVSYREPTGLVGSMALFLISTGPVWFGSAVIIGLSCLMGGTGFLWSVQASFPEDVSPATFKYLSSVFIAAFQMLKNAVIVWHWKSFWTPLYLYAVFCIASEITLSSPDLKSMWKGCVSIAVIMFIANLFQFTARYLDAGIDWAKPHLFLVQVVLAFVLMVDVLFLLVAFLITRFWRRKT